MIGRREQRMAQLIKTSLSQSILEMKDPRLELVTIIRVELAKDFKSARVFFSVLGDEARQRTALRGLEHARGKLQAELHNRIQLRYTPLLKFEYDPSIAQSIRISQILKEVLPESQPAPEPAPAEGEEPEVEET